MIQVLATTPLPTCSDGSLNTNNNKNVITHVGNYDVLCGRDKNAFNNIGNRRFRVTVSLALDRYTQALTRKEKSTVIHSVAILVQQNGGKFLQKNGEHSYIELNEKQRHDKVGHALRDMALAASKVEDKAAAAATAVVQPTPTLSTSAPIKRQLSPATTTAHLEQERLAKRQKVQLEQELHEPVRLQDFDDPTALDSEALRILTAAIPQIEPATVVVQNNNNTDVLPASLDVDDSDTILSWLMEESDQVLGFECL